MERCCGTCKWHCYENIDEGFVCYQYRQRVLRRLDGLGRFLRSLGGERRGVKSI